MRRNLLVKSACIGLILCGSLMGTVYSQGAGLPLWAYGYITPPAAPGDYSNKCLERPSGCDRPGGLPVDPQNTVRRLAGSDREFTVAQINSRYNPADWFPNDHPPMPDIVAHGKESIGARACGICHLPNGKGLMQNGGVAGLPADYILEQLADFKSGKRHSADLNKANAFEMQAIARNLTDAEAEAAAAYFSSLKFTKWVRVIESTTVPKFTATVNGLFLKDEGTDTVPLGNRVVEMPESTYDTNILRNPRSGFVAYVPVGSLKKGETLVTTGGETYAGGKVVKGPTLECGTCHGPDLRGQVMREGGFAPPIAGRSPSYLARALYDFKLGSRSGSAARIMRPTVQNLSENDVIAIVGYVASLEP
jgi:cytochrome c553